MKRITALLISIILVLLLGIPVFSVQKNTEQVSEKTTSESTAKQTPSQVKNLTFKGSTTNSVTITWSKASKANAYGIYQYNAKNRKYVYIGATKDLTHTIENLSSGKTYSFKVRAVNKTKDSTIVGEYSLACLALTKPEKVENVKTADISKTSITLYWDKVSGATGYRIYCYDRATKGYVKAGDTSTTQFKVSDLKENTYYTFLVRAFRKVEGSSAFSTVSDLYMECTNKSGIPETVAQAVRDYNCIVNAAKKEKNITVTYKKSIETSELSCSVRAIESTVRNTMNLFNGTLSKKYVFSNGKSGDITVNSLFEPYDNSAFLIPDYVETYSITKTKSGFKLYFKLKYDNVSYDGKKTLDSQYVTSVITPPRIENIETTPLVVTNADIYYDGPEVTISVVNGKLSAMKIVCASMINADFSVSTVNCNTIVAYEENEGYKITY